MENVWITLITVLGGLVTTLIGFLIDCNKKRKKEQKEIDKLKELCNYGYGCIDMINQASITVNPEVREAMREASMRYHEHDLTSIKKEKNKI